MNDDVTASVWEYREEVLYPAILQRPAADGTQLLTRDIFKSRFKQTAIDPVWLSYGVMTFPPHADRTSCAYVTSGLSNPIDEQDDGRSGLGLELRIELPAQSEWAIGLMLRLMAVQLLVAAGRIPVSRLFQPADLIPLGAPLDPGGSALTYIMVTLPPDMDTPLRLPSGEFAMMLMTGITASEANYARQNGATELVEILRTRTEYPITNPGRASVI
jgi:hypothetical protein